MTLKPQLPVAILFFFCASAFAQEDHLSKLSGLWVSVDPPRDRINFYRNGLGQLKAHLPNLPDDASITLAGRNADIEVSGTGYDCFYDLSPIDSKEILLSKKRGSNNCPESYHLKRDPKL